MIREYVEIECEKLPVVCSGVSKNLGNSNRYLSHEGNGIENQDSECVEEQMRDLS